MTSQFLFVLYEKVAQMLLEKGADVNTQAEGYATNALQGASYRGHNKVIQVLLRRVQNHLELTIW
jgi:ankyrin repeat protein